MMLEVQEKGIFRVENDASQIEFWTKAGWRLMAVFEDSEPMVASEQVVIPPIPGSCYVNTQNITKYLQISKHKYLLFKDEESAMSELLANLKQAQESHSKVEEDFKAFKKQSEAAIKELEALKREHKDICAGYQRIDKEAKEFEAEAMLKSKSDSDKIKELTLALENAHQRKKTAYERILEGEFDERVESLEAGDLGDRCEPVADLPQGSGVHAE